MNKTLKRIFTFALALLMLAGCLNSVSPVLGNFAVTAQAAVTAPAKVTGLKASKTTTNSITLVWNKASGAQKYAVYSYNPTTKKYTRIANTTANTYTVKSLKSYTTYYFVVKGYKNVNGTNYYGPISSRIAVRTQLSLDIEKIVITTDGKSRQLKLTWTSLNGVTGYVVYRSESGKSGTYKKIAVVKGTNTYTDKSLNSSTNYYYAVRAYKTTDSKHTYGKYKTAYLSTRPTKTFLAKRLAATDYVLYSLSCGFGADWGREKDMVTIKGEKYCRVRKFSSMAALKQYLEKYCSKEVYGQFLREYVEKNGKLYTCACEWGDRPPDGWTVTVKSLTDKTCTLAYTGYVDASAYGDSGYYYNTSEYKMAYRNGDWIFTSGRFLEMISFDLYQSSI